MNYVSVMEKKEVSAISAIMNVRYWEDATVNGKECESSSDIFGGDGESWNITISLDQGRIYFWPDGMEADVHFKVCDAGVYRLLDASGGIIYQKDGYVPNMLSPGGSGYGDYVIMKIDGEGKIENWRTDLDDFQDAINEE